jgi:hypothetical protein
VLSAEVLPRVIFREPVLFLPNVIVNVHFILDICNGEEDDEVEEEDEEKKILSLSLPSQNKITRQGTFACQRQVYADRLRDSELGSSLSLSTQSQS